MNGPLLRRTLAAYRIRVLACALGLFAWGFVLPVIYASFGKDLAAFVRNNPTFSQFAQFGGGDIFSLSGAMALGFVHPFTLLLMGIVAIGYSTVSVAGERQRGTLEVILARPISRHSLYVTLFVTGLIFLAVLLALELTANVISANVMGVGGEINSGNVPLLWLNGWLLYVSFMSIGFAASVSFDRLAPAVGITLVFVLVNYLIDVIGSLWPDAHWIQSYSMFELVPAKRVLERGLDLGSVGILVAIAVVAVAYAWVVFPRRDLAAPS